MDFRAITDEDTNDQDNRSANARTLLTLVGEDNWDCFPIRVFVDGEAEAQALDRATACDRVFCLAKLTFLTHRPDATCVARWAGVAPVSAIFGALSFFYDLLFLPIRRMRGNSPRQVGAQDGDGDGAGEGNGASAAQNAKRWALFQMFAASPWPSSVGCYLTTVFNRQVRDLLLFIFCFAEADGGPEVAKFKRQYMFEEWEIARRQALMAEGSDSGFTEWCSGRPTGKALAHMAMDLCVPGRHVDQTLLVCKRRLQATPGYDEDESHEHLSRLIGLLLCRGAASIDVRLHPHRCPHRLFRMADPRLDAAGVNHEARNLAPFLHRACKRHLDPFTKQFLNDHGDTLEDLVAARPCLQAIGKRAKLAIYEGECIHAEVRAGVQKSRGKTPKLKTASRNLMLSKLHTHHVRAFGFRNVADFWRQSSTHTRGNAWNVKRLLLKKRAKRRCETSWSLFRKEFIAQYRARHPTVKAVCQVPAFELQCSTAYWQLLPEGRAYLRRRARQSNFLAKQAAASNAQLDIAAPKPRVVVPWSDLGDATAGVQRLYPVSSYGRLEEQATRARSSTPSRPLSVRRLAGQV
jgi:hypothetical protein